MTARILCQSAVIALSVLMSGCGRPYVSFSADVLPILKEHCISCHDSSGEGVMTSGFSVSDYDSVMKGTKFGKVVIPGSSISSTLYLLIAQKTAPEIQMPPHHAQSQAKGRALPLSSGDVETIADWIDQGAKDN